MRPYQIVSIAAALAAVVIAYFAGRSQGPPARDGATTSVSSQARAAGARGNAEGGRPMTAGTLPSPGSPLKQTFAILQTRAKAGDVAAATRLYRDLNLCHRYAAIDVDVTRFAEQLLDENAPATDPQQRANYQAQLNAAESGQRQMDRFQVLCGGVGKDMLASLVTSLQRAAELGEPYARACYLDRGPSLDPKALLAHPQLLDSYRRSVPGMVQAGIAAGDWSVLELLRRAHAPGADSLLSALVDTDVEATYRHLALFRLGAGPQGDDALERDLATASSVLTSAQIAQAEAWAQTTFQQRFGGRSIDADGPLWDPCVFPYE